MESVAIHVYLFNDQIAERYLDLPGLRSVVRHDSPEAGWDKRCTVRCMNGIVCPFRTRAKMRGGVDTTMDTKTVVLWKPWQ